MQPRRAALLPLLPLLLALGCTPARAPAARCAWSATPPAAPPPSADYRYRVTAGPGAAELCVEVDVPRAASAQRTWGAERSLHPFVRDVALAGEGGFHPVRSAPDGWLVPACTAEPGCRLRYRVLVAEAAGVLHDFDAALEQNGAIFAPPSSWLLRPRAVRAPFLLAVTTAPGDAFVSGLALASPGAATFRGDVATLDEAPYAAFGRLSVRRKSVPGGAVDVAFAHGNAGPVIDTWIDRALGAVAAYYERFPIEHAALIVRLRAEDGIGGGHTMGYGGGAVLITVGEHTSAAALADDWILVHELVHVSFPNVSRPWAEEGLATYLEPIIRVRSGLVEVDDVWRSLLEGLPKGQPEDGDGGLDVTDTWGRRYWGGAMFWFLADVEIRKRTANARSLDTALRAVNRAGGNVATSWELDRVLALGDAATGVEVLGPLRKKMGSAPVRVDVDALWKSLGVSLQGGRVVYDDAAPLAAIRQGILGRGGAR